MKLLGWWPRRKPPVPPAAPARGPQPTAVGVADRGKGDWVPTHRHKKGGLYRLLGFGIHEADRSAVAIYDDAAGVIWVRSAAEFADGRFTRIAMGDGGP